MKLLFGYIYGVDSLRQLALELSTNSVCKDLGFEKTPFSTLKDGFSRFDSTYFKEIFDDLFTNIDLMRLPYIDEMGIFKVIDGTLLPTLIQMNWTKYRAKSNAFKLHFSFELNRMIPTEFLVGNGNSCERTNLLSMVVSAVTYIADRGYFSFGICHQIIQKDAFFIIRTKENLLFSIQRELVIHLKNIPNCFKNLTDDIVIFDNDLYQNQIRLIRFQVWGKQFFIATNRFDLTTLQLITLYAYRWQIELFFKYIKRTLNGIHLYNHSENGVQIQFYILLILTLLEIKLKQTCQMLQNINLFFTNCKEKIKQVFQFDGYSPADWIKNITYPLYHFWKISRNWRTILKNSLTKIPDNQLIMSLASH
jgi:hypothetical protein